MRLRQLKIRIGKIHHIFISHTHGDHIFGLYGLLSTLNLTGRKTPLYIYAPGEYGTILNSHLSDFDINLAYEIRFVPLKGDNPFIIYENGFMTVTAFPLRHRVPAFGFIFREKLMPRNLLKDAISEYSIPLASIPSIKNGADFVSGEGAVIPNNRITTDPPVPRSYAYCSDTSYFSRLSKFVSGVDLLYHEATFASDRSDLARDTGHSTSEDAARVAKDACAGELLLGHYSARYKDVSQLLMEARSIFPETIAGEDGVTYPVSGRNSIPKE